MNDAVDIARLLELRKATRAVSQHLTQELTGHLAVLARLLNPRVVFGEHVRGNKAVRSSSADQALEELKGLYAAVRGTKPFNLRREFDVPIEVLAAAPEVHPIVYGYEANGRDGVKSITITSPLKWVLSYKGFGLQGLETFSRGGSDGTGSELQACVVHCLLLHVTLKRQPALVRLLSALRFDLTMDPYPQWGGLPIAVLSGPLTTDRPPDDVIIESTEISGAASFEEVVDPGHIEGIVDPYKTALMERLEPGTS